VIPRVPSEDAGPEDRLRKRISVRPLGRAPATWDAM